MPAASPDAPEGVGGTLAFNNAMASMTDFLFSGVLHRFPNLKLAYSEGQIGWIPYILERADKATRILDVKSGRRRTLPHPFYTFSPDGQTAFAPDFARLDVTRPGYGYAGLPDPNRHLAAPKDSGIRLVFTLEGLLLVSVLVAFVPAAGLGFLAHGWIEAHLFSIGGVIAAQVAGAGLMFYAEAWRRKRQAPATPPAEITPARRGDAGA